MLALLWLWACDFEEPEVPPPPVPAVAPAPPVEEDLGEEVQPVLVDDPKPEPAPKRKKADDREITEVVRGYSGQVRYCYESALKQDPGLGGRLEMGWTIAGDGSVSDVRVVKNGTGSADVADCVKGKIARWKFPADKAGNDITWPFVLDAAP